MPKVKDFKGRFGGCRIGFKSNHQFITALCCKGGQENHSRSVVAVQYKFVLKN